MLGEPYNPIATLPGYLLLWANNSNICMVRPPRGGYTEAQACAWLPVGSLVAALDCVCILLLRTPDHVRESSGIAATISECGNSFTWLAPNR
jgi:hypothetical protein